MVLPEWEEEPVDDADHSNPIVRCHHCGTAVHRQEAQAITVDPDGALRVWTPERAAYFQRYAHVLAPIWHYLCPACYDDLFASEAQGGDGHGARLPQGKAGQESPAWPGRRR